MKEVVLTEGQIQRRVSEIADQIAHDYENKDVVMVCVMNGAAIFYIDLMMDMDIPLEMNFVRVSSYGTGTKSTGNVRMLYDLEADITDKHVLLVEDIIDSGHTLTALTEMLKKRSAERFRSRRTTWALTFPTNFSWDMGWTTRANTEI